MSPVLLALFALLCLAGSAWAQYPVVQVNNPLSEDPEEVAIAINPANPMEMIAGANLAYRYYSTDAGLTWTEGEHPGGTWGDPSVAFGPDGTAYFANLTYGWDAIIVRRSSNGGRGWGTPAKLRGPSSDSAKAGSFYNSSLQDKEWLIADHTQSPFRGNLYCSWTDFSKYGSENPNDSSHIVFSRSTDRGATFEPYVRISDTRGNAIDGDSTMEGAVPAVGPGGEVYIAWAGPEGIYFDRSFDGGVTFGKDAVISDMPGGWDQDISGIMRCNGLPVTLCDISESPSRGTVYVNWVDTRNGDHDVFIMKSTDRGDSWSDPIRVNDDPLNNGKVQFFTWSAVDKITGELVVVFYDRRAYQGDSTDVYMARSTDGGETFINERLTPEPFYPGVFVFFGDYIGVDAHNGVIRPIWTEMHNTTLSVHTALIGTPLGAGGLASVPSRISVGSVFPNPVRQSEAATLNVTVLIPSAAELTVTVYDALGRVHIERRASVLRAGSHYVPIDGSALPPGMYYCRVSAAYAPGRRESHPAGTGRFLVVQ